MVCRKWITGGSLTRICDIKHKEGDYLELPLRFKNNDFDQISMVKWDVQCYISAYFFFQKDFRYGTAHPDLVHMCRVLFLHPLSRTKEIQRKTRKEIIDKAHRQCAVTLISEISRRFSREIRFGMKTVQITSRIFSTRVLRATKPLHLPRCGLCRWTTSLGDWINFCFADFFHLEGLKFFHFMDSVCFTHSQLLWTTLNCVGLLWPLSEAGWVTSGFLNVYRLTMRSRRASFRTTSR